MKKVLLAIAVTVFAAANALAVTPPTNDSKTFSFGDVTGQTVSQLVTHGANTFFNYDTFNFSISGPNTSSSYLFNVAVPSILNATFTSLALYKSIGPGSWSLVGEDTNGGDGFSLLLGSLANATYQARVVGSVNGSAGGQYLYAMAAPVPEPHEWAMMLAGLGIVGTIAARRRKGSAAA